MYLNYKRHVLREEASDGTTGSSGGALDMNSAAAAFLSLGGNADEQKDEQAAASADESPEAAAERIAAEEATKAEAPKDETAAAPEKFTIKVDGKDVQLTADEVAEHYKNGLRQQDYTKKTMEAAEQRKAADAETAKAREQRDAYAQKLEHYSIKANGDIHDLAASLTQELLQTDPVEYLTRQHTLQARQVELNQAQQELQQINGLRQQEAQQAMQSHLQNQLEQLQAKVPEWKDMAKFEADSEQIRSYLMKEHGFAKAETQFQDHRGILLAQKAMQFDALMTKAKDAVKRVSSAPPKVERPGAGDVSNFDGRTKAMKKLSASGSLQDAAAAFLHFTS